MIIYTDGSCINQTGGWACCLLDGITELYLVGGEKNTTNNRMEMMAVIMALKECACSEYKECNIYTDSMLVLNCAQRLWKRNKNLDLWKQYDIVSAGWEISWHWVKGHSGDKYNDIVDRLARAEITGEKVDIE